jgi:hypothetical protein
MSQVDLRRRRSAVPACPTPEEIIEDVGVQIGAIGAPAFPRQILSVGEQLRSARRFRHELHAAGPFKLKREPHRLLDAAAGGDDAVVAQNERLMPGRAPGR